MKRQILIITGHPHNETQKAQLQIVGKYYDDYFKSNTGGAYEDAEITNLETPKVKEIQDLLKEDKKNRFRRAGAYWPWSDTRRQAIISN